ncbi:MAG TPA: BlaI/MecI/CopY family transcriptional regulator [Thermoanaerobaculia bacterium]|nr:BlaI/MecI/CopY family transcriptional regulator [Thermoanaerobaculia bacterium]
MPRKKTSGLTEAELRVMNVLWDAGEATVAQVQKALAAHRFAYTTVLTIIQILESKHYVGHRPAGRAYLYRPLVGRGQVRRAALQKFLSTWFDASPNALVLNLIDEDDLDADELEKALRSRAPDRRRK